MKKKIAFYIESMIVGGAEKVLIDLVNNLDQSEFDITVIALFRKSVYNDYEFQFESIFESHVKYKYLIDNSNRLKYISFNYLYNKLSKKWIYQKLIKEKFDTEVAFYEGLPTEFVAASTQNSKKIAWLHIAQQSIYKNYLQSEKDKKQDIYRKYGTIVGVSQAVAKSFELIFPNLQTQICYNPIDGRKVIEMAKSEIVNDKIPGIINFISVGRLTYQKAYSRLIDVLGILLREGFDFNLQIIGEGILRHEILERIKTNRLEKHVQLLGFLPNPYPYINRSDYFISSSFYEGLSTVVIEAQILGIPTIVTNCTGMSEIVNDGVNGLLCENSEDGILYSLRKVLLQHQYDSKTKDIVGELPSMLLFEEAMKCIELNLRN